MAKKSKPKNKSKPKTGRKKTKAEIKAEKVVQVSEKKYREAKKRYTKAKITYEQYDLDYKHASNEHWKKYYISKRNKAKRSLDSAKKHLHGISDSEAKAKAKAKRVEKKQKAYDDSIASAISDQKKKRNNEGNMAIYPTSTAKGGSRNIVFFAPVNTESESNSSSATSYAVDKGAPRKDYIRFNSKTVSIDGLISDTETESAHQKWVRLRTWHSYHRELTFKGDIYYKHLMITQLDRQFTGYKNTMQVSITFTFMRAAEITTSTKNKKNAKTSKSSKTVAGNRNKKYTSITIKKGDTLWGLSKRYGKSVSWLQRVNKIKNPNRIIAGDLIYVNDKKHKQKSKLRVR